MRYSPPGFGGITVYEVITFIIKELRKDNITTRANSVSFSLFLSVFPAIIFIFTLLPMIPVVHNYTVLLSDQLRGVIPQTAHDYIFSIINDITSIKRGGLLSLGAVLAMFFSSNGMLTLMYGFDKAYDDTFKPRPWWRARLIALGLTIVLFLLLIISLVITVTETKIIEYLKVQFLMPAALLHVVTVVHWIVSIALIYTGISLIYTFGPSMYRRMRFINVGSVVATILTLFASLGFSYFINNFGRYNEIYGSIGALMVMMVWIQFNTFILLVGFELNASLAVQWTQKGRRISRKKMKD